MEARDAGIYILKWKPETIAADSCMPNTAAGGIMASTIDTIDSLLSGTNRSVKLMYSVEIIPHEAFKYVRVRQCSRLV